MGQVCKWDETHNSIFKFVGQTALTLKKLKKIAMRIEAAFDGLSLGNSSSGKTSSRSSGNDNLEPMDISSTDKRQILRSKQRPEK